ASFGSFRTRAVSSTGSGVAPSMSPTTLRRTPPSRESMTPSVPPRMRSPATSSSFSLTTCQGLSGALRRSSVAVSLPQRATGTRGGGSAASAAAGARRARAAARRSRGPLRLPVNGCMDGSPGRQRLLARRYGDGERLGGRLVVALVDRLQFDGELAGAVWAEGGLRRQGGGPWRAR